MELQDSNLKRRMNNLKIVKENLTQIENELNIKLDHTQDVVNRHIDLLSIFLDDENEEEE